MVILPVFFCDQPATFTIEKGSEYAYIVNPETGEPAGARYSASGLCSGLFNLSIADNGTAVKPEEVVVSVMQQGETFGTKTFRVHSFDHFDVNPDREMIEHGETAYLTATAKDEEGNEVPLPEEMSLSITAAPSGYGHFETEETVGTSGPFPFTLANDLYYVADGTQPDSVQTITFTVARVDNPGKTGTGTLMLQPRSCPTVVLSKKQINPGDTIDVTIKRKFDDGTERDYPAGTLFFMYIYQGAEYGNLLGGGQFSSFIYNIEMPVKFVAVATIDADSAIVVISGEDGITSRIAPGKDTTMKPAMSLSKSVKKEGAAGKKELQSRVSSSYSVQGVNVSECGEPADTVVIKKEEEFDHFEVKVEKDTLLHGASATITALAKDGQNNDAELDGSTVLTLTMDSTQYGSFINAAGDTIPSPLENVLYSDAKDGKIKFTVNKANPIGLMPRKVTVAVTKTDDASKTGEDTVFVKEFVKIKIILNKTELKPLGNSDKKNNPNYKPEGPDKRKKIIDFSKVNKATITITVTDRFDKPVKDYKFTIKALGRSHSGGHDHTSNRPTGKFITARKDTLATVQDTTKADGKVTYTYLSSGFGGVDSLHLKGTTNEDTATALLTLKMGNFEELVAGTHYQLVGWTTEHPKNHFGTANLVKKLKALSDSMYARTKDTLRFNDMSLIMGGPFDCDTAYTWDTPHETHREGINADVSYYSPGGIRISERYYKYFVEKLKGEIDPHGHYHTTFK